MAGFAGAEPGDPVEEQADLRLLRKAVHVPGAHCSVWVQPRLDSHEHSSVVGPDIHDPDDDIVRGDDVDLERDLHGYDIDGRRPRQIRELAPFLGLLRMRNRRFEERFSRARGDTVGPTGGTAYGLCQGVGRQ